MADHICSKIQINEIASELNAGHQDAATRSLNACTIGLIMGSDYAKDMHKDFSRVMQGDPVATKSAEVDFARLANDERHLWQSISSAADRKNHQGLCHLTIVEDKDQGPHASITGAKCH